jgi:hypothetical protein
MLLSAFNHQFGLDGQGLFLVGRVPLPAMRWPWPLRRDAVSEERAFLLDEMADVRHRISELQGSQAR